MHMRRPTVCSLLKMRECTRDACNVIQNENVPTDRPTTVSVVSDDSDLVEMMMSQYDNSKQHEQRERTFVLGLCRCTLASRAFHIHVPHPLRLCKIDQLQLGPLLCEFGHGEVDVLGVVVDHGRASEPRAKEFGTGACRGGVVGGLKDGTAGFCQGGQATGGDDCGCHEWRWVG